MNNVFNCIHKSRDNDADKELFFGPIESTDTFVIFETNNLSEILVNLKLVPSISFCRKNGWFRELKPGFQEITFGKSRVKLFILNQFP